MEMAMNLTASRVNANLTRIQVAKELKININTLANYERYKTKPDIDTAKKLAKLYGCSIDDIKWSEE